MANTKSAAKRARQSIKRRSANRSTTAALRTQVRKLRDAIAKKDAGAIDTELKLATKLLDKAGSAGLVKKSNASRRVSRLAAAAHAAKSGAGEKATS